MGRTALLCVAFPPVCIVQITFLLLAKAAFPISPDQGGGGGCDRLRRSRWLAALTRFYTHVALIPPG